MWYVNYISIKLLKKCSQVRKWLSLLLGTRCHTLYYCIFQQLSVTTTATSATIREKEELHCPFLSSVALKSSWIGDEGHHWESIWHCQLYYSRTLRWGVHQMGGEIRCWTVKRVSDVYDTSIKHWTSCLQVLLSDPQKHLTLDAVDFTFSKNVQQFIQTIEQNISIRNLSVNTKLSSD